MNENNKKISVKMRVVAFSDLSTVKEVSFKQVGVGQMKLNNIKKINDNAKKQENVTNYKEENKIEKDNNYSQEDLEREGNESLF